MTRKILVADLLCGAGGSSTGCARALAELGLSMELVCVNHWGVAIETHRKNHPEARHYVQDIAACRPHLLVPEGWLDLLMASPACTHHSVARGGKPTSDQQRSDPWHINTWLTELDVRCFIIENVWEFLGWGPVDPKTSRPIAARKGEYFRAWTDALRAIGYQLKYRKLNAANYGDATTRQRFIMKGRKDRRPIGWAPITHQKRMDGLALFPGVKPWRPAREIIDWKLKGRSIFARKKPLAPKTLARIHAGAVKFGWPEPFLVILRNHMNAQSIEAPVPTIAANGLHIGLVEQVIVRTDMHGRKSPGARGAQDPLMTITTAGGIGFAEPLVLSQHNSGAPRSADDPLPTITTGGAASPDHPGCARPMLVEPFITNGRKNNQPKGVSTEPVPALDTKGGVWITEPFILSRQGEGAPRSTDEPMCTQTAVHSPVLISPYYGSGSGETCKSADDPLDTITAKDRFGMVVPITHAGGSDRARSVDDPLATITTAHRGELAFITAQHGERETQPPRVHSVDEPAPTITAQSHTLAEGIVVPVFDGMRYDILFRMLEPHELAAAMGFDTEETTYQFAGTKTEQIKQIGNAVSVAMMKAEVKAIMAGPAPKRRRPPALRATSPTLGEERGVAA